MNDEEYDPKEIMRYTHENVLHHLWSSALFHYWPCAVWDGTRISWEDLRDHGLIPPYYFLINDHDDDVV